MVYRIAQKFSKLLDLVRFQIGIQLLTFQKNIMIKILTEEEISDIRQAMKENSSYELASVWITKVDDRTLTIKLGYENSFSYTITTSHDAPTIEEIENRDDFISGYKEMCSYFDLYELEKAKANYKLNTIHSMYGLKEMNHTVKQEDFSTYYEIIFVYANGFKYLVSDKWNKNSAEEQIKELNTMSVILIENSKDFCMKYRQYLKTITL